MSDFLERMNEISRRQGKAPIDSTYIQGSGTPWPALPENPDEGEEWVDPPPAPPSMTQIPEDTGPTIVHVEPVGEEPEVVPSSPPAQQRKPQPRAQQPELVVWGDRAVFKDTEVRLNEADTRVVVRVVLNAAHRSLREQMDLFGVAPARRPRVKKAPVVAEAKPKAVKQRKKRQRLSGEVS